MFTEVVYVLNKLVMMFHNKNYTNFTNFRYICDFSEIFVDIVINMSY